MSGLRHSNGLPKLSSDTLMCGALIGEQQLAAKDAELRQCRKELAESEKLLFKKDLEIDRANARIDQLAEKVNEVNDICSALQVEFAKKSAQYTTRLDELQNIQRQQRVEAENLRARVSEENSR